MKNGHKRLLIFELILLVLIFVLSVFTKFLTNYYKAGFILLVTFIFKFLFGLEKDQQRKSKDAIIELIILLLASFLIFYVLGIFAGFYRTENFFTVHGIFGIVIPMVLIIIFTEILRYNVLRKSEGSKLLVVLSIILFIVLDLSQNYNSGIFESKKAMFDFFAFFFVPSISNNLAASYVSYKAGIKPNILWLVIVKTYMYMLPIIPQFGNYIMAIIECVFPYFIIFKIKNFFDLEEDKEVERDYNKGRVYVSIIPLLFLGLMVYLTCGKFSYLSIAIASGSMVPTFNRGDVVIVHKVDDYTKLKAGDVIAFNYGGVTTVHRLTIVDIDNGYYYFYTKGDANKTIDSFVLSGENIIGTVEFVVPFVGYPTVWLSEV